MIHTRNAVRALPVLVAGMIAQSVFAQTVLPKAGTPASYSFKGLLSNYACYPERLNAGGTDGVILHADENPNPAISASNYTQVAGRYVTACASFEVDAVVPASVTAEYRAVSASVAGCSDGAKAPYAGTGGEIEVFASPDPVRSADQTWKFVEVLPRHANFSPGTLYFPANFGTVRSVMLCRNGGAIERDDVEVRSVSLAGTAQATTPAPSTESSNSSNLFAFWNTAYQSLAPDIDANQLATSTWTNSYAAYFSYPLMSGWSVFQVPDWRRRSEQLLDWAHANRVSVHNLPYSPAMETHGYARDTMAREALAYYHAYATFGTSRYLTWADDIAIAMLDKLSLHSVVNPKAPTGPAFSLFHEHYYYQTDVDANGTNYCGMAGMLAINASGFCAKNYPSGDIDPNQNAEVGLLFTVLANDKNSRIYSLKRTAALAVARDHLDSAISIQQTDGALPVSTSSAPGTNQDTGYASYTFSLLAEANAYWNSASYTDALQRGGNWLSLHFSTSPKYAYINSNSEPVCDGQKVGTLQPCEKAVEMWWRIPAYYYAGKQLSDFSGYMQKLYTTTSWPSANGWLPTGETKYDGRFLFLKAAGIPQSYYLPRP